MKILYVSSEIYPFAKLGGLGDVADALPRALAGDGMDVRLLLPGYPDVLKNLENPAVLAVQARFCGQDTARIVLGRLPHGLMAYVIDIPRFYDRSGIYYNENGHDWPDNHLRFGALGFVAASLDSYDRGWKPDIVHGQDWLCGMMPVYLNAREQDRPKSVLTVHNLAYQGLFPFSTCASLALPQSCFSVAGVEFYGQVGFLKAGLYYADAITAVSQTYAREIQDPVLGCGLDGLLRHRARDLRGILNGIDTDIWDSEKDSYLHAPYGVSTIRDKRKNRHALMEALGLSVRKNVPLFGVVSRMVPQKGLDLLPEAMTESLDAGAGLVILGAGDAVLQAQMQKLSARWPGQVAVKTGYNETLAHRIIGGADALLVPSRFEPCGLVQMYALRYGTLPVVRRTGGLADTVEGNGPGANGFLFEEANVADMEDALRRVRKTFRRPGLWMCMQRNAMARDFSWKKSARQYRILYADLLARDVPQSLSA